MSDRLITYFTPQGVYDEVQYAFTCEYVTEGWSYDLSGKRVPWPTMTPSPDEMERIRDRLIASKIDGDMFNMLRWEHPDSFRTELLGLSPLKHHDELFDELCMIFDEMLVFHFGEGGMFFPAYPQ
jgi:hypothetical protein